MQGLTCLGVADLDSVGTNEVQTWNVAGEKFMLDKRLKNMISSYQDFRLNLVVAYLAS